MVSVTLENFRRLTADPDMSPRISAPFFIFSDAREVTLMLDEIDFKKMRPALGGARVEQKFRMLTFEIELDFKIVGFLSEISGILAGAGVPILALSAFSRDHILVRQQHLAKALKALGPYTDEIC